MNTKQYRDKATGRFIKSPASRSQELYSELYRAFDMFNAVFADNKLPKVVITIQESGKVKQLKFIKELEKVKVV